MLNYLNVGCGNKYHKDWVNIDMVSYSPYVKKVNLIKGIPFPENSFEVVYHSQVLEHIPKDQATVFMRECYRVLKPGGILRVVVPDLENVINEYRRILDWNLENPSPESAEAYDWVMIELLDQLIRTQSGGKMKQYLSRPDIPNENYLIERGGFVMKKILNDRKLNKNNKVKLKDKVKKAFSSWSGFNYAFEQASEKIGAKIGLLSPIAQVGAFRLGGEVHLWMYDRYSLPRLLKESGFTDIKQLDPFHSDIVNWSSFELDVKEGNIYDKTSIFFEGRKSF